MCMWRAAFQIHSFLASKFDKEAIFRRNIDLINSIENDGVLAIDDTIVEKIS